MATPPPPRPDDGRVPLASLLLDARAEPLVRRLLFLGELRRQDDSKHNVDAEASSGSGAHYVGAELERLRQERQLLTLLRGALEGAEEVLNGGGEGELQSTERAEAANRGRRVEAAHKIGRQLTGAAVPLFAILQRQHRQTHQNQRPTSNTVNERLDVIIRSAEYACVEEAAAALRDTWRLRQRAFVGLELDNEAKANRAENGSTLEIDDGIKALVLPSLISCAVALSSLDIANAEAPGLNTSGGAGDADNGTDDAEKKNMGEASRNDERALDRGEECAVAVLSCVRSFFQSGDGHDARVDFALPEVGASRDDVGGGSMSDMSKEVSSAMGGALVARLVQGCLSLLPGGDIAEANDGGKVHGSENTALQLEALATLRAIMVGIPSRDLWGSILPGCFAGLYRAALSKLRYASASSSYKVGAGCVRAIALLLKQSLSYEPSNGGEGGPNKTDEIQSIADSLMAAVKRVELDKASAPKEVSQEEERLEQLKTEVNKRLPGPLSVLLSLLTTNRSDAVRKSGLYLCRAILIDTCSIWFGSHSKALSKKSLEYCLAMLCDDDAELSRCSRETLRAYKSYLGVSGWKQLLGQSVAPAILELAEALPVFARSGRESEVRNHLCLIDGYLLASFRGTDNDFDMQECLERRRKSDIGSALGCAEAVKVLTKSFSVLFAPDVNSISSGPLIESGSTTDPNAMVLFRRDGGYRFLYLREGAAGAAKSTVHLLAKSFGAKRCAYAVDACVAEVFESRSRSCNDHLLSGEGLNRRTHWSGVCVFATELLRGLGERNDLSKSHLRMLSSLASSVLPAIVADLLWTLPTVFNSGEIAQPNESMGPEQRSSRNKGAQSVAIMHSNAILISSLMGLMCQFTHSLGDDISLHLPTILLAILERASPIGNHSSVQRSAFSLLWEISLGIGHKDVSSLLASNVDYLTDAISLRLRKHARGQSPMGRSLLGVVDVILRSLVHGRDPSFNEDSGVPSVMAHVATVVHMLDRFLDHFDRQTYATDVTIFDTVGVFRSMCSFMEASVDSYIESSSKDSVSPAPNQDINEWFNRLDFELNVETARYEEDADRPDVPFEELDQVEGPATEVPRADAAGDETNSVLTKEIDAINSILKRCCYLLGYGDLKIQTLCCDTIVCGFQALGKVGAFRKAILGASASNPLLPSIAEFWPSIVARLRTASASLASVNQISRSDLSIRHAMASDQETGPSKASLDFLISKLLQIVSELCLRSDGFFVDRFENDAFPILAGLIQDCHSAGQQFGSYSTTQQKHPLLLSILDCFKCTYESSCGHGLAHLIPTAGTMLFPLLVYEDPIGEAVMASLEAMLAVDCDGLWRGIHKLSGRSFPCNPILSEKSSSSKSIIAIAADRHDHILSERAGELLNFVEKLPEQHV